MSEALTSYFEEYREHARHLRNTAFDTRQSRDWDVIEDFEAVASVLFERLVLYRVAKIDYEAAKNWKESADFLIEPSGGGFPVMISSDKGCTGSWDHEVTLLFPGDATIAFLKYWDWDEHGRIDFRYYYGVIVSSASYPELRDHHVLIETNSADIRANTRRTS